MIQLFLFGGAIFCSFPPPIWNALIFNLLWRRDMMKTHSLKWHTSSTEAAVPWEWEDLTRSQCSRSVLFYVLTGRENPIPLSSSPSSPFPTPLLFLLLLPLLCLVYYWPFALLSYQIFLSVDIGYLSAYRGIIYALLINFYSVLHKVIWLIEINYFLMLQ